MPINAFVSAADAVLKPRGFRRRKMVWNRKSDGTVDKLDNVVDVVSLQRSKAGDAVTVNVGVLSASVFRLCWGENPRDFLDAAHCTVQARLGQWMQGQEHWWKETAKGAPHDVARALVEESLPFLERMHSPGAMEQFLIDTRVLERGYPPPIVYLAILKSQRGDVRDARDILKQLLECTSEPWRVRISGIMAALSCHPLASDEPQAEWRARGAEPLRE